MRSLAILIVAAMLAVCITPALASALDCTCGELCVNESGWWHDGGTFNASDTRIQDAINNASVGDSIYVYNGSYSENVYVNQQLTLQGEGADVVTVTNHCRLSRF